MVKRGSVLTSFETIRSKRPSSGCELAEVGNEISNRSFESAIAARDSADGPLASTTEARKSPGRHFKLAPLTVGGRTRDGGVWPIVEIRPMFLSSQLGMYELHGPTLGPG